MHLPRLTCTPRLLAGLFMAGLLSTTGWTQSSQQTTPATLPAAPSPQRFEVKDYTKPRSHFPNPIGPYLRIHGGMGRRSPDPSAINALQRHLGNVNSWETSLVITGQGAWSREGRKKSD